MSYESEELEEVLKIANKITSHFGEVINAKAAPQFDDDKTANYYGDIGDAYHYTNTNTELQSIAKKINSYAMAKDWDDSYKLEMVKIELANLANKLRETGLSKEDLEYLNKMHDEFNNVELFIELKKLKELEADLLKLGKEINGTTYEPNKKINIGQYVTDDMTLEEFTNKEEKKPTLSHVDKELKAMENECAKLRKDSAQNTKHSSMFKQLINNFWNKVQSLFGHKNLPKQVLFVDESKFDKVNKKGELLLYNKSKREGQAKEEESAKAEGRLTAAQKEQAADPFFKTKSKFDW